ncbi:MAG: hypothetical protein H7X71_06200 [Chitinophagales bacterium]|nr:hypothetical protein [Chitinophagales bacterium]
MKPANTFIVLILNMYFSYCAFAQTSEKKEMLELITANNQWSVGFSLHQFNPALTTQVSGDAHLTGKNMAGAQVNSYVTTYLTPHLAIRGGLLIGAQPLDYQFYFRADEFTSTAGQEILVSMTQEPLFDREYIFYATVPAQAELRLALSEKLHFLFDAGISFNYYFQKSSGSLGWLYTGIPPWDTIEMVKILIPEENGFPDQKIFLSYPFSFGLSYVLPNYHLITCNIKENFGGTRFFGADYIIFPGTDEESTGHFIKESNYIAIELLYTFTGLKGYKETAGE